MNLACSSTYCVSCHGFTISTSHECLVNLIGLLNLHPFSFNGILEVAILPVWGRLKSSAWTKGDGIQILDYSQNSERNLDQLLLS